MTEINKYHTSKIYKISSPQCDKFYIGSTIKTLKARLSKHKADYKIYLEKGIGSCMTSFEIVKFDDCIIELIKDVNCESKKELERIEGECILEHHDRILNKKVAGRTQKEYHEANKEHFKNTKKEYYELHKEHLYNKQKEWNETHKEHLYNIKKEYYEVYKDRLQEKFNCDCGGKYTFQSKSRHTKSQKHQLFISNNI